MMYMMYMWCVHMMYVCIIVCIIVYIHHVCIYAYNILLCVICYIMCSGRSGLLVQQGQQDESEL